MAEYYKFIPVDLDNINQPKPLTSLLEYLRASLPDWTSRGTLRCESHGEPELYLIWENRDRQTAALVNLHTVERPGFPTQVGFHLKFWTEFEDGGNLCTRNDVTSLVYCGHHPESQAIVMPGTLNPVELLDLHEAAIHRFHAGRQRRAPCIPDCAEWLTAQMRALMRRGLASGTHRALETGVLQFTWKGAFLQGLDSFPIAIRLRRRLARRRAKTLLRRLHLPIGYAYGNRVPRQWLGEPASLPEIDVALTCPECGYNLTGTAEDRCPECGLQYAPDILGPICAAGIRVVSASRAADSVVSYSLIFLGSSLGILTVYSMAMGYRRVSTEAAMLWSGVTLVAMSRAGWPMSQRLAAGIAAGRALETRNALLMRDRSSIRRTALRLMLSQLALAATILAVYFGFIWQRL